MFEGKGVMDGWTDGALYPLLDENEMQRNELSIKELRSTGVLLMREGIGNEANRRWGIVSKIPVTPTNSIKKRHFAAARVVLDISLLL